MNRDELAGLGRQTAEICTAGTYTAPSGGAVSIRDSLGRAVAGTRDYPAGSALPSPRTDLHRTIFEVRNETTLAAARRLSNRNVVALNFASAKHPGGGHLSGARAQEESLARASGLVPCIAGSAMYAHHRAASDAMYSTWAVWSPGVPVFRACAFITSPAVNAKVVLERDGSRRAAIRATMDERVRWVLVIAAAHGHESLVLGAWGCGVFGNDPAEVAELFHAALTTTFRGTFGHVAFAVLDRERATIAPFESHFRSGSP
jgi:uncharacterized protein (TIGR02452 family)